MRPRILNPGANDLGDFGRLITRNRLGAEIRGKYKVLNLAGARIIDGPLYAADNSSADLILLSGTYSPRGIDLTRLYADNVYGQAIFTDGDLRLGEVGHDIDFSASIIKGQLDLGRITYTVDMSLERGIFGTLNFGQDINRKFGVFDLQGTQISEVRGYHPAEIRELYMDSETKVPEVFLKYLRMVKGNPDTRQ